MKTRPVAIVTGATAPGRVGIAIARELASAGCHVVVTHRPGASAERLAEAAAEIQRGHSEGSAGSQPRARLGVASEVSTPIVRFEALDLSDPRAAQAWARTIGGELPRVDVLVHNASAYSPTPAGSPLDGDQIGGIEHQYRVNALSPLLITRALAAKLAASPLGAEPHRGGRGCGGAVVTLCDAHAMGEHGRPRRAHAGYSMSKAALLELTMVLARELAPGVRVNGVAPGFITPPEGPERAMHGRYSSELPLGACGSAIDAARAVAWLALESRCVTGQVIRLDGGRALL